MVSDQTTGEPLIGATVIYGPSQGVVTDFDGRFNFEVADGEHEMTCSYVGYETKQISFTATGKPLQLNVSLNTITLNEVQVVADVAIDRKTPVAFSTIPALKVEEELASQDIPMVLNSTPGVYATQSGGGDGDARISIRGFNQRNVAVMIDGIPVNDMENGWVYWSNWFGLDAVTGNIQVQRGLGASKIAIPSVGGTMNILTKGIAQKAGGMFKQEVGAYGKLRSTLSYNSGRLENGWGYTLGASYKRGKGYVEQTPSEGVFYYLKVQKALGKHTLSFSAMGAPQEHGQRSYKSDIATYDTTFARSLGDTSSFDGRIVNKGVSYNKHWGYLNRWTLAANGDTIHDRQILNTKQNYYHKPQFSLRDFWAVNDKLYVSNIAYASIGHGGGTGISGADIGTNGQLDLQSEYDANATFLDPSYSDTETKSGVYQRSSINNHYWYGLLSTMNYRHNEELTFSGGLDARYYKGEHYRVVYDLLGGDYAIDLSNRQQSAMMKRVGDKVGYHNDGLVKWGGAFAQLEYDKEKFSAFLNISAAQSAYKRIDYFRKKDLVLADTTYENALGTSMSSTFVYDENGQIIGVSKEMVPDTIVHLGKAYTMYSAEAKLSETAWKLLKGYTFKGGANYNINEHHNVFMNLGYISKAPRFNNVFDYSNELYRDIENECVQAVEAGYAYRSSLFSANVNVYHTQWMNKPSNGGVSVEVDDVVYKANINGMDALHKGLELDFAYKISPQLTIEGLLSLGDWQWQSADTVRFLDDDQQAIVDDFGNEVMTTFDAKAVHVGDAAQTQYGASLRYEPIEGAYVKMRATYFADYYSDFDPLTLNGENAGRESWKIPAYTLLDMHAGYRLKLSKSHKLDFKLSVLNALDEVYISDAQNNDPYNANYQDFDAKSAGVFFGLGRRYNASIKFTF